MDRKDWLTAKEVAELTGFKYRHFWVYLKRGHIPPPEMNLGHKPLWKRESIENLHFTPRSIPYTPDDQVLLPNEEYLSKKENTYE